MTTTKALTLALVLGFAGPALAWEEPARGTQLRADLMDALRPIAEFNLGAPIEFVVQDLRVEDNQGFASVYAQRPGGVEIDISQTPIVLRGMLDPEISDGTTMQALFTRSGSQWVPVVHETGATDVWYASPAFCPNWSAVLPEICDTDKN